MPMWLARVIVVLLYLGGFAFMIAMGIYLKNVAPGWFDTYGYWTVMGMFAASVLVICSVTYLIEITIERRRGQR